MKKLFFALLIPLAITSCKETAGNDPVLKAPVDSLIKSFSDGWNNHDSAAVRNLFATDALLSDDNLIAVNAGEISGKWISPNIRMLSGFKATKLQDWSTNDRASYTGKYEFDVVVNDSVVAKPRGVFTLIWKKSVEGNWEITSATIHSFINKNDQPLL